MDKLVTPQKPMFQFEVVTVNWELSGGDKKIVLDRHPGQAEYFREDLGGVALDMVAIPGGTFPMGSPEDEAKRSSQESPQHSIRISPFHIGKFAITQAQYQAIVGTNPSGFKGNNRPVEQVTWDEAIAFCQKLSEKTGKAYRLPSEAEWEYACRAGTTTPFHFGETITTDLVNFEGNYTYGFAAKGTYRKQTTDVGRFPPNGFGLYDMHGNVWEWCADPFHDTYQGAPNDGSVWQIENDRENQFRVVRGGSWHINPKYSRSAHRFKYVRDSWGNVGFRVVVSAARN
jgi:eukaryotic-like serine/threonine-protein kinase